MRKSAGLIIEATHPHIFWTPCVVHTLNLALKNLCSPADTPENRDRYEEFKWIVKIDKDVRAIRNFVVNHELALTIFNWHSRLQMLGVEETRFASSIIMVRQVNIV
ncbi:hypothetical protein AMTRI_Chr01g137760 [Amborella trichopoda]